MVQGVVVQITTAASCMRTSVAFTMGNRTQIVVLVWSRYSISASARAVFSTGDHMIGRKPRFSAPFSKNLQISWTMAPSDGRSMVA